MELSNEEESEALRAENKRLRLLVKEQDEKVAKLEHRVSDILIQNLDIN